MRIVGRERIGNLGRANDDRDRWLRSWFAEIASANWKCREDVIAQFPRVVHAGSGFRFPMSDEPIAINVAIAFHQGVVLITGVEVASRP